MNGFISLSATLLLLLALGGGLGLVDRGGFRWSWLLAAALLVAINDALLTGLWGLLPNLIPGAERNWQGKLLALAGTIGIAFWLGRRETGLVLAQAPGSLKSAIPVAALYCGFFLLLAWWFPNGETSTENLVFQLTMPGLEEESFYRGILLFALYQAFAGRWRFLGVDWSWGAILSCLLFGMTHAFGFSGGAFSFDPLIMALTAFPAMIGIWLRLRTGSLLLPIVIHNFGNLIMNLV